MTSVLVEDMPGRAETLPVIRAVRRRADVRPALRAWAARVLLAVVAANVVLVAVCGGIRLRQWLWASSAHSLRFFGDISNAWARGSDVYFLSRGMAVEEQRQNHEPLPPLAPPIRATWPQFFRAYLADYDRTFARHEDGNYGLDYPPMRLLVMSAWVKHVRDADPEITNWNDRVVEPLLALNTCLELFAAVLAFALVWYWMRGHSPSPGTLGEGRGEGDLENRESFTIQNHPHPNPLPEYREREAVGTFSIAIAAAGALFIAGVRIWQLEVLPSVDAWAAIVVLVMALVTGVRRLPGGHRAWASGAVAALLVWFNAPLILEAHAWPQWDGWLVPVYLLAALLISLGWGFTAGAVLVVGAMMKGQILLVAPVLLLWPLFAGRFAVAARAFTGFATCAAALGSIWLVPSPTAWAWVGCVMLAPAAAIPWITARRPRWRLLAASAMIAVALIGWPFIAGSPWLWMAIALLSTIALAAARRLVTRRSAASWLALVFTLAIVGAAARFGGSLAWLWIGFGYGARHFQAMDMGATTFASVLGETFHWQLHEVVGSLRLGPLELSDIKLRKLLVLIDAAALVACAAAAAMHSRRGSPKVLAALAAPWVIFFAVLAQMHDRYLLWGGVLTAIAAPLAVEMTLLSLLASAMATVMILRSMLFNHTSYDPRLLQYTVAVHPGIGWAVLTLAAIYFWIVITPDRSVSARRSLHRRP